MIIAFSSTSTSDPRNDFNDGSAFRRSNALTISLRTIFASFMPTHRIRMATSSLGTKPTVISVSSLKPSRSNVFSPVTTPFKSLKSIFFRLSATVRVMLSVVCRFCANSSGGTSGGLPFPMAAAVSSEVSFSSINNITINCRVLQNSLLNAHARKKVCHQKKICIFVIQTTSYTPWLSTSQTLN